MLEHQLGVLLQIPHVLFRQDPANDLLLSVDLLLLGFAVLQLPSLVLLAQSVLVGLQFLSLDQSSVPPLLVLNFLSLLLLHLALLVQFHPAGLQDFVQQGLSKIGNTSRMGCTS